MVRRFRAPSRARAITRLPRLPVITATEPLPPIQTLELAAAERLAPPRPPRRWKPWAWAVAILLHAAVIALFFVSLKRKEPEGNALAPTGIQIVYDAGAPAAAAPRVAPIPAPAQTPPSSAPPPPQTVQAQPEVNLNIPENAFAQIQQAPQPPQAQPVPAPRPAPRPPRPQKYTVMNGMSFGNSSPTPPMPNAQTGLNLSLPQSNWQSDTQQSVSIQGNIGADWQAGFNKWVYAHLYYPDAAAKQGQQGTVTVQFTAHKDGHVTGLKMTDSSGSPFLDQAWSGIFLNNLLPKFPPGSDNSINITATVRYMIVGPQN
jgi:protein TonB